MSVASVGIGQRISLVSDAPSLTVTAIRGASAPTITGGYGGWSTVTRPRKKALTEWLGQSPLQMSLPLLFDGYPDQSVELPIARLERLAGPVDERGGEPPLVSVVGAAPHGSLTIDPSAVGAHAVGVSWVINAIDWGDPVIVHPGGYRLRQGATVTLLEYVADDRLGNVGSAEQTRLDALARASNAARAAGVGGATPPHDKHYVVHQGDTLSSIAAVQLGDYKRWIEIADLNNIRDPRRIVVGQTLRLP